MALLFGFSLATPDNLITLVIMAACLMVMCLPLLIRWHDVLLVMAWNMPVTVFFLPGQPQLWMLLVFCSLIIGTVSRALSRNINPELATSRGGGEKWVSRFLIALVAVVLLTAHMRGGIGSRALGSETYGARKYLAIVCAVLGYFALTRIRILPRNANRLALLFFGGSILLCMSNLIYMAGPSFYWLYYFIPVDYAVSQAAADINGEMLSRLNGLAFGMSGVIYCFLARYGIRGIFTLEHPFRLMFFIAAIILSMFGGFRSLLVLTFLVLLLQFYFEGLFRTQLFVIFILVVTLGLSTSVLFIQKMPLSVQRTLSFLPVDVDPVIRETANDSVEWRLNMWKVLLDQVPRYLVIGKGYSSDASELALFEWHRMTGGGHFEDFEEQMMVGNYHSGPFSVLLSFGIFGVLLVVGFWIASIRLLWQYYARGRPELRLINTLLLSCFLARVVFFLFLFGDMAADLPLFCGLVGLGVALNRAPACDEEPEPEPEPAPADPALT